MNDTTDQRKLGLLQRKSSNLNPMIRGRGGSIVHPLLTECKYCHANIEGRWDSLAFECFCSVACRTLFERRTRENNLASDAKPRELDPRTDKRRGEP